MKMPYYPINLDIRNRNCLVIIISTDPSASVASKETLETVNALVSTGAQVYPVGRNQDINRSLDSHRIAATQYFIN